MAIDYSAHTVLITGASSGIGAQFAKDLAARGASLVLVARRLDRLDALAADLRRDHGVRVETMTADLSDPAASHKVHQELGERGIAVTALINNAGFGTFGDFTEEDVSGVVREIAVDVAAPTILSRLFLPDIIAAGNGFLINVASMAAYTPTPRMAVYGATKAYVLSFTEALWAELRGTGVTVFALSPGATATEFNTVVGTEDATAGATKRSAEDVVATALQHLESRRPGPSVIDGRTNRTAAGLTRLTSRRTTVRLMDRLTDPSRRR